MRFFKRTRDVVADAQAELDAQPHRPVPVRMSRRQAITDTNGVFVEYERPPLRMTTKR